MPVQVTIELPDDAYAVLRTTPDRFAEALKLAALCQWYDQGLVSQSRGAALAGVSRAEFLAILSRHGVSPYQVTPEELEAEVLRG